ncbi:MAG: winged helix-turn-helix domain-containing protein [Xanthobacteraceae bacterium]|nr:winged helix-turn-helix domain-containing protein [Xanthobacteraceae bacterium]
MARGRPRARRAAAVPARRPRSPGTLWTSRMVGELIRTHLGVKLSKASVCRLLNQLGLSAQRPLWRAYQQDRAMVERWMAEVFPAIRERGQARGRADLVRGRGGVRSDAHAGTTTGPRGHTPVVSSTGARFGIHIISAVSQRGDFRFMCIEEGVNASVFLEFLRRPGSQRAVQGVPDRRWPSGSQGEDGA